MSVSPIPKGYNQACPYLIVEDIGQLMDFLITVFGAEELDRHTMPDGKVAHGEVRIGDSVIMMCAPQNGFEASESMIHVYVEDVDSIYDKALKNGAEAIMPPADQFYGDRSGGVKGPQGNSWWIATHKEDLSPEELEKRAMESMGAQD